MKTLTELQETHTLRPIKELTAEQQELVFEIKKLEYEYEEKLKDINTAYEEGEKLCIFE